MTMNPSKFYRRTTAEQVIKLETSRPDYTCASPLKTIDVFSENTQIEKLLKKRHSCRGFAERAVEVNKIAAICRASYSFNLYPVASAGGLYPLSIYFINRIGSNDFPRGVYQYDPFKDQILLLRSELMDEELFYSLNDSSFIFNSTCIFFIVADVARHNAKYSNRGYRHTLVEVILAQVAVQLILN